MEEQPTKFTKYAPLIIGVFLGVISVIMSKIPPAIALWSGMIMLGNHFGYLLGALTVAYLNSQKWLRNFLTSTLTIIIAAIVYYLIIYIFSVFDIGYTESVGDMLQGLALWSAIGLVCGVLSATAMYFARYGRTRLLRIGALITTYLGMLGVIYLYYVRSIINFYNNPQVIERGYITGYFAGRNFAGDIFEVMFAFVLVTVLFVITVRIARNKV